MKERLRRGDKLYGSFVTNPGWSGYVEILSHLGYDCVFFDTEHSPLSYDQLEQLARTARLGGIHPVVRVSDPEYAKVARAMDTGIASVMIPRIETADQVRDVVRWAKYPPAGRRGAGGYRTLFEPDKEKLLRETNEAGLLIIQIESRKGMEHLHEILQVEGVDAVFIGPFDLSVDVGVPGQTKHPLVSDAIEQIVETCRKGQMPVGIHLGDIGQLRYWAKRGVTLLSLGSDIGAMYAKADENIRGIRQAADGEDESGSL